MNAVFWKIYAYFYDALSELLPYQHLMRSAIDAVGDDKGKTIVLDAGCGTGNLEWSLSRSQRKNAIAVEAIDSSPAMLRKAEKKMKNTPWVTFQATDLNAPLPCRNDFFSNVVSINSLYAAHDPCHVLDEFYRKLKTGGKLIIANPKRNPKITDVFLDHVRMIAKEKGMRRACLLLRNLVKIPQFVIIVLLNLLIVKLGKNNTYHFFDLDEFRELIHESKFDIIESKYLYGNMDVFIIAQK